MGAENEPFRFIRIFQHGWNSCTHKNGRNVLMCGGIELYGELTEMDDEHFATADETFVETQVQPLYSRQITRRPDLHKMHNLSVVTGR